MAKICDNKSAGVIIRDSQGRLALLTRAKFPSGIAPPAGHVDDHGSPEQTAIDEVSEEVGLRINPDDLKPTSIQQQRVMNRCSREGGDHHDWWVYEADKWDGDIVPDPDETKGARWYTPKEFQALAARTAAYRQGTVSDADWEASPGLEPVWFDFMQQLGYIH